MSTCQAGDTATVVGSSRRSEKKKEKDGRNGGNIKHGVRDNCPQNHHYSKYDTAYIWWVLSSLLYIRTLINFSGAEMTEVGGASGLAYQEVGQGVPESGQAPFAQKRRVVNLVDAHVRASRKIFALPSTDVGASLGNHLRWTHTRHGG